jgi:hypothetical protein
MIHAMSSQGMVATPGAMHASQATQVPRMHAMSPIQERQAPINQSVTHGLHLDPWPTRAPKPPQEHMYTRDRLNGPQDNHPEEAHPEWGPLGIGRP